MFDTTGLLEPQKPHALTLLQSLYFNGVAVDTSETGCGKTYVAAALARAIHKKVVVVCPKLVMPVWKRILESYGITPEIVVNYEKLCRGNTPWLKYRKPRKGEDKDDRDELIVLKFPSNYFILVDESHKCKGVDSLNSGFQRALKKQGYLTLLISATQACSVLDMRALGYSTNMHSGDMKDFRSFCRDYGARMEADYQEGCKSARVSKRRAAGLKTVRGVWKFDEASHEKFRLCHENLFHTQKIGSRLTREMMGDLFPENEIVAEAYDMGQGSKAIQHAYEDMEYELDKLDERTENYSGHIFAIIVKWRRQIELLKVPAILEMTEDLFDENKSVVIFVNYTDTINILKARLEANPKFSGKIGYIYGEASEKQRLADIEAFEQDNKRIIICNLGCGGSINLHDLNGKHSRASIINPNFSAILMLQALGRIHRTYGKTKCYQRLLFAANTYEDHICRKVQLKLDNLSILNDGDLSINSGWFRFVLGKGI